MTNCIQWYSIGALTSTLLLLAPACTDGSETAETTIQGGGVAEAGSASATDSGLPDGPSGSTSESVSGDGGDETASDGGGSTSDSSETETDAETGTTGTDTDSGSGPLFPEVDDFGARGPFDTLTEAGGTECTMYRPVILGEEGRRHPVIVWGNGTGVTPSTYNGGLDHFASHGFIVAAANTTNSGSGVEMISCLDWVLAEADRADSEYADAVAEFAGASGHSQGGGGTLMAGREPRIAVTVPFQPYVLGLGHDPASQSTQQGPMLLLSGGADFIAGRAANQQPVFDNSNVPVFWATLESGDHIQTPSGDMGGYRGLITAWFRLHLMADNNARPLFYGADCTLCGEAGWIIERKDID